MNSLRLNQFIMINFKRIIAILAIVMPISLWGKNYPAKGDFSLQVFDKTNVCFQPDKFGGYADDGSLIRLMNGRIIIKKITIPEYQRSIKMSATVTIQSNGDRWDKSGSCFVIPKEAITNIMDIAKGEKQYPAIDAQKLEKLVGILPAEGYIPNIEIMRFMTPFGVGHFSNPDNELSAPRKPVYIDHWAEQVEWKQDITDLYPALVGEVYVGIYIDTWTDKGYLASLKLDIKESQIKQDGRKEAHLLPIINTVPYVNQEFPDIFARKDIVTEIDVPKGAKAVRLKYITTGHGGHSGGDEFTPQLNEVKVDGKTVLSFTPWRTDCASFRRFNPGTGVWLIKRIASYIDDETGEYTQKEIEEPLGSSDLSRSNWCPGSDVWPEEVVLGDLAPGRHTVTFSIPNAQPSADNEMNHWLVSSYLVW